MSDSGKGEGFLDLPGCLGRQLVRLVYSVPQVAVHEEFEPQERNQIGQTPGDPASHLQILQKQDGDHCCPNLDIDGISAGTHEGLALEVLL